MKILSRVLATLFLAGGLASAATLTFDELPDYPYGDPNWAWVDSGPIPAGYGGLNWSAFFGYMPGTMYPGSGYDLGTISGPNVALNAFDSVVTVDDGSFVFNSAYFTSAWDPSETLTIRGWLAGNPVGSAAFTIVNTGPTLITLNWTVDTLEFNTPVGYHFAMDNMTINSGSTPEGGATLALLGMALLGLFGIRRKAS
jgi:hypothetical protein